MKNLGPILLDKQTASEVAIAARSFGLNRHVTLTKPPLARPRRHLALIVGDLLWVQEPCVLYVHKKFGTSQLVFGDISEARAPEGWPLHKLRKHVDDGSSLSASQSRFTLEVEAILEFSAVRFLVHGENVADLLRRKSA